MQIVVSMKNSAGWVMGLALLIFGVDHPDALRRTDLRADTARCAAILAGLGIIDQHRDVAEPLRQLAPLLRILDGEDAVLVRRRVWSSCSFPPAYRLATS